MVGAVGGFGKLGPIFHHRCQHHTHARRTSHRPDDAGIGYGTIHPTRTFEARREIVDFHCASVFAFQARDENGGIAFITLRSAGLAFQFEAPDTTIPRITVQ